MCIRDSLLKFCADYGKIQDNPCFRTRRPGDMFRPAGDPVAYRIRGALIALRAEMCIRDRTLAAAPAAVRHTALARLIAAAAPQQKMSLVPEADALLAKGEGAVQLCEGVWL